MDSGMTGTQIHVLFGVSPYLAREIALRAKRVKEKYGDAPSSASKAIL
jgi:hypothetical protein